MNVFDAVTCCKIKYQHSIHLLILTFLALRVVHTLTLLYTRQWFSPSGIKFHAQLCMCWLKSEPNLVKLLSLYRLGVSVYDSGGICFVLSVAYRLYVLLQ